MTKFKLSMITGALLASSAAFAQVTAITGATVHTATEQGTITNATVVIEDGKIKAINPQNMAADITVPAQGLVLTPGFIGSMNQLGLVEVGAVARSRDASDEKAGLDFDPSYAFNPRSSLIPYARKGGITQNVVAPINWDGVYSGLAFTADLSGDFESITDKHTALVIDLGARSKGSRALSFQQLVDKLEGQTAKLKKSEDKKEDKKADKPSGEERVLTQLLEAKLPLVIDVNRAADILQVIKLKTQFSLDVIIRGGSDAVLIADKIAQAKIPVIVSGVSNLPSDFDAMHASLENAGKLEKAGVKVLLSVFGDGSHNLYQLRYDAGIAVSNGMSFDNAIKAVTSNVADAFAIDGGKIAVGQRADLVLWSADPFELSTHVEKVWINGEEVSTQSRHDKLRDRYTTDSALPHAYTK
ncbi:Imidazolonepropionase [Pseudoalteromonas holothuriae]|uniref:Imidazolonepropionase n=1 Tax=Pseudoalteromonas holothuriae TaxID=2963714 RepID=A0A9W4R1C9_9GAMM|nr:MULTISPECIES: amidohydrolase family protein [unclassified Pseudoalteromonas]CAH9061658.1 Imidazolonepropionase [Pseudoalteromonas sp. CIP111951]CAH9061946.1 Imidazolonepropionase [Pseudoalteromonas sp. CIP111854]